MSDRPIDLKLVTHVCVKIPCTGLGCVGGRTHVGAEYPEYGEVVDCRWCRGTALVTHDVPLEMFAALVQRTNAARGGSK